MDDLDEAICGFDDKGGDDEFDEDRTFGCAFPGECCIPGEHYFSECCTAEMMEAMNAEYEVIDPAILDAQNNHTQEAND
jgi:hypothetical protein